MLRPSRPALLPHHRFRAGTVQTLQAAQGQARGRGQAWGFWDCAPKPEVTSDSMSDTDSDTDSDAGHVPTAVESIAESDVVNMQADIKQLEEEMRTISKLAINNAASIGAMSQINTEKTPDEHSDKLSWLPKDPPSHGLGGTRHPDKAPPKIWTPPKLKQDNPDATGDGNPPTILEKKYSLRCSRAGPTSKPRHSGYGDLRV
jgi:hypothetical protein